VATVAGLEAHDPQEPDAITGSRLLVGEFGVSRIAVFWIQVTYLAVLAAIGYWAVVGPTPPGLSFPALLGVVPSGVLWFGALGGVMISLTGVFEHRRDWDRDYWTWHVARPFVGAAIATVAVITFQCGVLAVGSSANPSGPTANLFYYLVAFVVGYREETARTLMKRVVDVILAPGGEPTPPKGPG
jgi:hypothetical protein